MRIATRPFLLIVRTGRIITALSGRVAPDTRMFQHIAEFYNYLGQLIVTAAVYRGLVS